MRAKSEDDQLFVKLYDDLLKKMVMLAMIFKIIP